MCLGSQWFDHDILSIIQDMMRSTYIITVHQLHHPLGRRRWPDLQLLCLAIFRGCATWQAFHTTTLISGTKGVVFGLPLTLFLTFAPRSSRDRELCSRVPQKLEVL